MTTRPRRLRYDPQNDLYTVLGVASNATADQLQQAFRRQAKQVHPDRNPDKLAWAHEQFQLLNEAYDILSNEQWREVYDRQRRFFIARHGQLDESEYWTGQRPKSRSSSPPPPRPAPRPAPAAPRPTHGLARWRAILSDLLIGPYRYLPAVLFGVLLLNIIFVFAFVSASNSEMAALTLTPQASPTPEFSPTPEQVEIRQPVVPRGWLVLEATQSRIISAGTIYGKMPYSVSLTEWERASTARNT